MNKDTVLYTTMKKYRRKFLICNLIALMFLCLFTIWKFPYFKTWIFGPANLNVEKFIQDADSFTVDGVVELDRHDLQEPETQYYKDNSYWQGDNYLFNIEVDSLKKTGLVYTSSVEISENNSIDYESSEIYLAEINNKNIVVIALPHQKYTKRLKGFLVKPSQAVISDLSKRSGAPDSMTLCNYFIDCRDLDMGTEATDIVVFEIWLAVLILLFIKLTVYYLKPETTPTFRQLRHYGNIGEVADDIEQQIKSDSTYMDGKDFVTCDYILSDKPFKKKVIRNHMK